MCDASQYVMSVTWRRSQETGLFRSRGAVMRATLFLPVVALIFSSCATPPPVTTSPAIPEGAMSVPIRRDDNAVSLFQGNSGMTDSARVVIRNEADWRRTWAQLIGHITPAPEAPPVDFTKEMVIVAAMGTRPTAGSMIRIARVGRSSGLRSRSMGSIATHVDLSGHWLTFVDEQLLELLANGQSQSPARRRR